MKRSIMKRLAWIAFCMLAVCLVMSATVTEAEVAGGAGNASVPVGTELSADVRAIRPGDVDFTPDNVNVIRKGEALPKYDLPSNTVYVIVKQAHGTLLVWSVEDDGDKFIEQDLLELVMSTDTSIKGTEQLVFVSGEGDFNVGEMLGNSNWGTYSFRLDEQTGEVTMLCDKTKVNHIDYMTAKATIETTPPETSEPDSAETPKPQESETPKPQESETPKPQESETPKPQESETPKPQESETPKPEESETPKPQESETPKPQESETPAPAESETPKPDTARYYSRNTACSFGPRFRDVSQLTDQWYRFTPLDLSTDGVQTYELIASDAYMIGLVTVKVAEGTVTIDCAYVSDEVKVHETFCTLLPSLAETETLNLAQLKNYAFGEPINVAEDLGSDTKVLLFIRNVVDYNTGMPVVRIYPNTSAFKARIDALMKNMD